MDVTNYSAQRHLPVPVYTLLPLLCLTVSLAAGNAVAQSGADTTGEEPAIMLDPVWQNLQIPEVLTTTRLRQPKSRVPGTTTVIMGSMIRDLGIMNLVEVFRLVPGMTVAEVGSYHPVATYHGTVHYEQRRIQVLIDGRTAYRPTLSDMEWNSMPVPLELIERIEIARGPNSAAYGINAFLGTINIITRTPADSAGTELRVASGSRGYRRAFGSVADATGDYDWRFSWEKREFDGFDVQLGPPINEPMDFNDGYEFNTFQYDSNAQLTDTYSLDIRTGVIDGVDEEDRFKSGELGAQTQPNIDVRDYHIQTRLNGQINDRHFFHLQANYGRFNRLQRWTGCFPEPALEIIEQGNWIDADDIDDMVDNGDPLVCAQANADQKDERIDFEIQDTVIINPDLKFVAGAGHRKDTYESETYFNGKGHVFQSRAFGNIEYTPASWITLNGGANWEKTSTTDESYFSPRVATNFVFHPDHTLRLVYSSAVRTPDEFEQSPDYSFRLRDVDPSDARWEGVRIRSIDIWDDPELVTLGKELEEETIISREISYFGQFRFSPALLSLEVRYFQDELRDMISGLIQFDDWTLDNNVALDQEGFEIEATVDFPGTALRMSYAYIDQEGWYTGPADYDEGSKQYAVDLLGRMTVRHSGSVAWIQDWAYGLKSSTSYYFADEFARMKAQFERLDLRLAKQFFGARANYEVAFTMQHFMHNGRTMSPDNIIRERNQFFLEGSLQF